MNGVNLGQRSFIYDARSRLRSVHDSTFLTGGSLCEGLVDENNGGTLCQTAPTPVFNARDSVAYSAVGNITYLNTPTVTGTPVYSRNRLKDWPRPGGTFSYVVDTAGFRTRVDKGTTPWTFYRWTPDGLLDTVRVGAGSNVVRRIKYDYNAFGELVRRSIDGTVDRHFLWDRGNLLAELNGTLTARRSEYAHFPGLDAPFALLTGATTIAEVLMVQRDPLGNVLGLTTTAGAVKTDQLRTSEWGQLFTLPAVNDTTTMRLRWKGMMYEADSTQLYYVRTRWYDPQSRRFLSEDPIGIKGGINPFTFGGNDPISHSDPEGLEWECVDQMVWVFGFETSVEWHTKCTSKGDPISWKGILGNVQRGPDAAKGGRSGRGSGYGSAKAPPGFLDGQTVSPACSDAVFELGKALALDVPVTRSLMLARKAWTVGMGAWQSRILIEGFAQRAAVEQGARTLTSGAQGMAVGALSRYYSSTAGLAYYGNKTPSQSRRPEMWIPVVNSLGAASRYFASC